MQKWEEEAIIRDEAKVEGKTEQRIEDIKKVMKSFKVTAENAMEALGIPKSEYNKYMTML